MVFGSKKRITLGDTGEKIARKFLVQQGYKIREINYRVSLGEIDIIAEENSDLVFIEVKTRSSDGFGSPAEAVTIAKQRQIIKVAEYYLSEKNNFDISLRFDVVSVLLGKDGKPIIEIIENAFEQN